MCVNSTYLPTLVRPDSRVTLGNVSKLSKQIHIHPRQGNFNEWR